MVLNLPSKCLKTFFILHLILCCFVMIKTGLIASYLIISYKNDEITVKFPPLSWPPFHFHPLGDWTPHSLDIVFSLAELALSMDNRKTFYYPCRMPVACQHVVVQFYPCFKLYFLLFQTHYHTLSYLKTKENKI